MHTHAKIFTEINFSFILEIINYYRISTRRFKAHAVGILWGLLRRAYQCAMVDVVPQGLLPELPNVSVRDRVHRGFLFQVVIFHSVIFPLNIDFELKVDGVVHLFSLHHLHQGDRDADSGRSRTAIFGSSDRWNVLVVVFSTAL